MDVLGNMTEAMLARALAEELGVSPHSPAATLMPGLVQHCMTTDQSATEALRHVLDRVTPEKVENP